METLESVIAADYKHGFVTDIEADTFPPGLSEDTIRALSAKKNEPEWMLEYRLKAFRHWLTLVEPHWQNVTYETPDYQGISYYSAPSRSRSSTASTPSTPSSWPPSSGSASRSPSRSGS